MFKGDCYMGDSITLEKKAYAKLNLCLDVIGEREDGYHFVRMIMQNIDLHDTLYFTLSDEEKDVADVKELITFSTDSGRIPSDERNLAFKAAKLMYETYGLKKPIDIRLEKRIPVEAGMAGGSSDAAAVFHAVNELYGLNAPVEKLMELGVTIGSDIPFCILGKTALSEGIGEKLTPITPLDDCYILVAKPPLSLNTKYIYTNLDHDGDMDHPDVDGMVEAMNNHDLNGITRRFGNVLESVSVKEYREIQAIKATMVVCHSKGALMTGSGPTVFGIFEKEEHAKQAYASIEKQGIAENIYITHPVSN